ncbi:MAG: hypothetical protein KDJ40_01765, partial [Hyphomicrobiales bacterium]|nr:hypothetical protein [Hyphomicrobiales bacterium]
MRQRNAGGRESALDRAVMDALHDNDFREAAAEPRRDAPVAHSSAPPSYLVDHYWWAYVHP